MSTLVLIYDDLASAERSRDEMLGDGFPRANLQIRASDDEAGPVEGSFTVRNARRSGAGSEYERNFGKVMQRGMFILTVEAASDAERDNACTIAKRFGGTDVESRRR